MNVFVILADSWRHDHFGCYGNEWIRTPHIDELARDGFVFDAAFSANMPTLPNRIDLFTGRQNLKFRGWQHVEPTDELLAEALWDKGMETAFITDTYHMHKPGMAYERGFDAVRYIRGQEHDPHIVDDSIEIDPLAHTKMRDVEKDPSAEFWNEKVKDQMRYYERLRARMKSDEDSMAARVFKEAIRWIEERKGSDNLFLWIDSFDPHEVWDPFPPFDRMYQPEYEGKDLWQPVPGPDDGYLTDDELKNLQALYAGMCSQTDKWIGAFLERARALGFYDNTLILFTSDHGEPLGSGVWGHGIIRKCMILPYEELAHIPLVARHPDGLGAGQRSKALVQPCDVAPTILDFLGVDGLPRRHGTSLLPVMSGDAESIRDIAISGAHGRSWALRDDRWTYVKWFGDKAGGGKHEVRGGFVDKVSPPELYDRRRDRYELDNVIEDYPDVAHRLDSRLSDYMDRLV